MKKVLDKLRNQSTTAQKYEIDVKETVSSDNFKFGKVSQKFTPFYCL